ncbi:MAG: hypothetical protein D6736_08305 [Nitrospinota bacterium]|nr:MAG: hypothetical protein D6736_08305 [Nitrospinota bacterium]
MVVIFGPQNDPCVHHTSRYLRQQGEEVLLVEDASRLASGGLCWALDRPHNESYFLVDSQPIPFASLSGILLRTLPENQSQPEMSLPDQQYIASELQATLVGVFHALPCPVINRPLPWRFHRSLMAGWEQVNLITGCGLQLPPTLITSRYEEAACFYAHHGQAIVNTPAKPDHRQSIRGKEGTEELKRLFAQQSLALQAVPSGQWLQVFVVGQQVFGATPQSALLEEGIGEPLLQPVELSPTLQQRCCRLVQGLQIDFAQLCLLQAEREVYCFDIHLLPQYEQCDSRLQERIAAALATLLSPGEKELRDDSPPGQAGRSDDRLCLHLPAG